MRLATARLALAASAALVLGALGGCASVPVERISAGADAAGAAADHALKMVGRPYRQGGASPAAGFDCSGLVQFSYRQAGVRLPRSTEAQLAASAPVPRAHLRRGDLVFFHQEGKRFSHVGLYVGGGRFVHAPSSGRTVRTDRLDAPYWRRHLAETRRL